MTIIIYYIFIVTESKHIYLKVNTDKRAECNLLYFSVHHNAFICFKLCNNKDTNKLF